MSDPKNSKKKMLIVDVSIAVVILGVSFLVQWLLSKRRRHLEMQKISLSSYSEIAMTGDVVFFSSMQMEVRSMIMNPWSHVGLIIVDKDKGILLWESNVTDDYEQKHPLVDQLTMIHGKGGPQLVKFSEKINVFKGDICIKRLISPTLYKNRDDENQRRNQLITPLMENSIHYTFEDGPLFWIPVYFYFRSMLPGTDLLVKDCVKRKKMFCSEAVVEGLRALGAVCDHIKPQVMLPPDILQNRIMDNGWLLGDSMLLKD